MILEIRDYNGVSMTNKRHCSKFGADQSKFYPQHQRTYLCVC